MISVKEAQNKIFKSLSTSETITIPAEKALSFHLKEDVISDRPIPPFNRVAMDGFAVKSSDFKTNKVSLKVIGTVAAGDSANIEIKSGEAVKIMTGSPLCKGADAVVKVEQSELKGDIVTLQEDKMRPMLNIALMGEDANEGDLLLEKGNKLSPSAIAVCSSVGLSLVEVYKKPKIKIICTGSEIIPADQTPLPHQIRDCNSYSLRSMCESLFIKPEFLGIAVDEHELLKAKIKEGLESDILLLTGGVSMGDFDLVPDLLEECGVEKIFHKVNLKPGKPVWFGKTKTNNFVFGLPGNPVSVQVNFKLFVEPLIQKFCGSKSPEPTFLNLRLFEEIKKRNTREQYFPAELVSKKGQTFVKKVNIKGSGDFSNLAKSQGLIKCLADTKLLEADSFVEYYPWGAI